MTWMVSYKYINDRPGTFASLRVTATSKEGAREAAKLILRNIISAIKIVSVVKAKDFVYDEPYEPFGGEIR